MFKHSTHKGMWQCRLARHQRPRGPDAGQTSTGNIQLHTMTMMHTVPNSYVCDAVMQSTEGFGVTRRWIHIQ
jgi:hypothetical protein